MSSEGRAAGVDAGETIELPAPAKLNLFLHVVGRRADGYHELQTVFQFVDLADRVHIARRGDEAVRRTAAIPGVAEADDLAIRAARLLRGEAGVGEGAGIDVVDEVDRQRNVGIAAIEAAVFVGIGLVVRAAAAG